MLLISILFVAFASVPFIANGELTCGAGYYLVKDPETKEEKCVSCEAGTYLSDKKHRREFCNYCTADPVEGDRKQVNRPCTSKSDTEIGCSTKKGFEAYRQPRHPGSVELVCKPCTWCEEGENEIRPCTEYSDRECRVLINKTDILQPYTNIEKSASTSIETGDEGGGQKNNPRETATTTTPKTGTNANQISSDELLAAVMRACSKPCITKDTSKPCHCTCECNAFFSGTETYIVTGGVSLLVLLMFAGVAKVDWSRWKLSNLFSKCSSCGNVCDYSFEGVETSTTGI